MEQAVFMPVFKGLEKSNEKAEKVIREVFKGKTIATVESSEIAREGGVLNCITWNIRK